MNPERVPINGRQGQWDPPACTVVTVLTRTTRTSHRLSKNSGNSGSMLVLTLGATGTSDSQKHTKILKGQQYTSAVLVWVREACDGMNDKVSVFAVLSESMADSCGQE